MTGDADKYTHLNFKKGALLLEEGKGGDCAYIIVSGKVEIRKGIASPNPQVLATRVRGDVIGEMALFDDRPHMATAVAVEDTVVNAMSRQEFNRRLEAMDPVMRGIMKLMVDRLRDMADDLVRRKEAVNWANWRRTDK